ncbi:HxlR family transcriptional regulator [Maritalea mobilis]|uniref:HxlR family transcriptional regulator n=1 Tax=Maritalea mobilis TaxID=483324 RepID=A0A4R6VD59_9HYPH|nr:helix-turn-helix domain-containing protein [Maritalea mobilis]TDQ60223.1 HxlR family transcriptional regulator [Maritalea mobilis]
MSSILPNKPVRGSGSGVPIMALFDILGRKWNMRMLWSLRQGALSFRSLQAECGGVSPSVMNARLKQLQAAQLVLLGEGGYELTAMGRDLMDRLDPLREWSAQWSAILEE